MPDGTAGSIGGLNAEAIPSNSPVQEKLSEHGRSAGFEETAGNGVIDIRRDSISTCKPCALLLHLM